MLEKSPVSESRSNGAAENAVREAEAMIRTTKIALEDALGRSILTNENVFVWLVEHASTFTLTLDQVEYICVGLTNV